MGKRIMIDPITRIEGLFKDRGGSGKRKSKRRMELGTDVPGY